MKRALVAAAAFAVCSLGIGTTAALAAQDDGATNQPPAGAQPAPPSEPSVPSDPQAPPSDPARPPGPGTTPPPLPSDPVPPPEPSPEVSLVLDPDSGVPGQTVITATATCDDPDGAELSSPVLESVPLTRDPDGHQPWALRGTTSIVPEAQPGTYPVFADCSDGLAAAVITVLRPDGGVEDDDGQVPRVPRGAPQTGGGDPR